MQPWFHWVASLLNPLQWEDAGLDTGVGDYPPAFVSLTLNLYNQPTVLYTVLLYKGREGEPSVY